VRVSPLGLRIVAYGLFAGACSGPVASGFPDSAVGGADSGVGADSHVGPSTGSDATTHKLGGGQSDSSTTGPTGDAAKKGDGGCVVTDPNTDMDHDGWTPNQGDCNDCNPNVNPGAIDVLLAWPDGGTPVYGDEDCSGVPGDSAKPCDEGLALTDLDPNDAAKAIELCQVATATDRKYGVISAQYVRANGAAFASPGVQVGIQPNFGPNVHVQGGANMLALSSGAARIIGQTGACNGISCEFNATATAPAGFPDPDPTCPPVQRIADDVALQVQVRVPTNATGFSFSFKFHSFEYPDWVCTNNGYNDQFVALVTPPPAGSDIPTGATAGNISFDQNHHPVGVNIGYFSVCDPTTPQRFADHCTSSSTVTCPALPSPYCPDGTAQLLNTGFDVWNHDGPDGATSWLQSQAPVTPGSTITLQFTIWDAGNGEYDSTVLVDNIQWNATAGVTTPTPVVVSTQPVQSPK
jgi:hypothetical protein